MLAILMSAALITGSPSDAGEADKDKVSVAHQSQDMIVQAGDPAQQINRGIVLAQRGDLGAAREMFIAARDNRELIDLQIPSGHWVDSRSLARRALIMLKRGAFAKQGQMALR